MADANAETLVAEAAFEKDTSGQVDKSTEVNPLALSDDDFRNLMPPSADPKPEPKVEPKPEVKEEGAAGAAGGEGDKKPTEGTKAVEPAAGAEAKAAEGADDAVKAAEVVDPLDAARSAAAKTGTKVKTDLKTEVGTKVEAKPAAKADAKAEGKAEGKVDPKPDGAVAAETPPDYEGFYNRIMTPFKANGRTIELKDPAEAIQLMQMGANYTRKMQDMVPHRKVLAMLQNNNLLDEGKLSYLIDLDKKDPEAIKKLIKDSGLDPLEIDTTVEPKYLEGNHRVTDEEVNFRSALDELSSSQPGQETLQDINKRWDQASKEQLWKHPQTLTIIHAQREVGIYDRIVDEMDRQKTLGKIPAETPFLQGYKIVGDELTAANAFQDLQAKFEAEQGGTSKVASEAKAGEAKVEVKPKEEPKVIATRTEKPSSSVKNDDQASAAAPARSTGSSAKDFINPLAMPDDEFLKQFRGRL